MTNVAPSATDLRSAGDIDCGTRRVFLDAPIDCLTMTETLAAIETALRERTLLLHVCLNVAKFVAMRSNQELDRDVRASHLISVDGMGIVWAARLLGIAVPERVSGVDLMDRVLALCAAKGYRPYFLGATPAVLDGALAAARTRYPCLAIAGARNGYFGPDDEQTVVEAIRASHADCLFIGMPTPIKERFLNRYRDGLGIPFIMGVGGSLDVLAGHVRRAPRWAQAIGCEWLWRMLQEPRRLGPRYVKTNAAFAGILAKAVLQKGI